MLQALSSIFCRPVARLRLQAADSLAPAEADALALHLSESPSCSARFDALHGAIIAALRDTSLGDTACVLALIAGPGFMSGTRRYRRFKIPA